MKLNTKTIVIAVVAIAAIAGIIYFIRKKKDPVSGVDDTRGSIAADDDATYKKMKDLMAKGVANWQANGPWILEAVAKRYNGEESINEGALVNGQATKSGALWDVYSRGVANWSLDGEAGHENKELSDKLWYMFNDFKSRNITI